MIIIFNLFEFPEEDFESILLQLGRNIKINNGAYTRAIINNSKINLNADYRYIITKDSIKRGDLITWDHSAWLILSEVAQKQYTYYKAEMRRCNFSIKIILDGIVREFPCIIDNKLVDYDTGKFFDLPENRITVTLANNYISSQIATNDRFIKLGNAWQVIGKDLTRDGLIILHAEKDNINSSDDLENEIANAGDYVYSLEITNGDSISLQPDATIQLNTNLYLNNQLVTNKPIGFSSSNTSICSVNEQGLVSAISEGTCTITAYMKDMPNIKDTIEVTVCEVVADNFTYEIIGESAVKKGWAETYIAKKYNNGVLVQDAEFDFEVIPKEGTPTDAYKLTVLSSNECKIECLKSVYYITLRAKDKSNNEYVEKEIKLKNIY